MLRVDRVEDNRTYYDHTWQEVHDALENGQRCVVVTENTETYIDENTGGTVVVSQTDVSELVSITRVSETGGDTYTASAITGGLYNADGANSALYLVPFN